MAPAGEMNRRLAYHYYGEPGSPAWKAGGVAALEAQQRKRDDEQRKKGLVDVFDFGDEYKGRIKYSCNNYLSPIDPVIQEIGKYFRLDGTKVRAIFSSEYDHYEPDERGRMVNLALLRKVTLHSGKLANFELWGNEIESDIEL